MQFINQPNALSLSRFLNVLSEHKVKGDKEKYLENVLIVFDKTVRDQFPFLELSLPKDGSLSFFSGVAVSNKIIESTSLKKNDPEIAKYGMPMVGVLPEDFEEHGAMIFDAYQCINLSAFVGGHERIRHVNYPEAKWAMTPLVCTNKRKYGINKDTCIDRPVHTALEIYLEYLRMDKTGMDFRLKSWPHGG